MAKKKVITKPPLNRFGGVRVVERRINKSDVLDHSKDAVAQEIVDIARANIGHIMEWDSNGNVKVKDSRILMNLLLRPLKELKLFLVKMVTAWK